MLCQHWNYRRLKQFPTRDIEDKEIVKLYNTSFYEKLFKYTVLTSVRCKAEIISFFHQVIYSLLFLLLCNYNVQLDKKI